MTILYDATSGEFDEGSYNVTQSENCYEIEFDNGFSLIADEDTVFPVRGINGKVLNLRLSDMSWGMVIGLTIPNCCQLIDYKGESIDERANKLETYLAACGRINNFLTEDDLAKLGVSFSEIENLVNSLGYGTVMKKATAKNKSNRFIKGKLIDAIFWGDCERRITSITSTDSFGFKVERLSGESKIVVCSGLSLVPFYV